MDQKQHISGIIQGTTSNSKGVSDGATNEQAPLHINIPVETKCSNKLAVRKR